MYLSSIYTKLYQRFKDRTDSTKSPLPLCELKPAPNLSEPLQYQPGLFDNSIRGGWPAEAPTHTQTARGAGSGKPL